MDAIELIAKSSGQVTPVTGNGPLSLSRPGVVKIAAAPEDVQSLSRNGDHLLVRLKTGKVITVENFFQGFDGVHNDLVLQAPDGQLWQAGYEEPWDGMELTRLDSVDELLALQSDDHNVAFGLLVPAAGLGAIGVGNMLTQRDGGGGGSPRSVGPLPEGQAPGAPQILFNNQQGLTGTAEPGSLITLTRPDGSTETATTNADGTWSFLPNPLEDGQSGSVTASNGDGASPAVDTGPADLTPPKDPVVSENNANGLSGTGEAGDTIILTKPDGSTVTTVVDENGNWSFPENPLGNGESGSLVEVDPAGNSSGSVDTGLADLEVPEPPVVTENNGNGLGGTGEPEGIVSVERPDGSTVTAIVDENGNWEFPENPLENGESGSITITDPAGNVSPPTVTEPADVVAPEPPVVTENNGNGLGGTGEPEGIVTVELPDGSTVTAIVDESGNWEFPENPLENGETGSVTITDPAGNVSPPTITDPADLLPPVLPEGHEWLQLIDDIGEVTGEIAKGGVTDDARPEVIGDCGADSDAVLAFIYFDGALLGSATVTAGKWSFPLESDLAAGAHQFQVELQDAAGNRSAKSEPWDFTLELPDAPEAPSIDWVQDDQEPLVVELQPGDSTNDRSPIVGGSGVPGSLLTLYVDDQAVGSVTVGEDGKWEIAIADLGADGAKRISADQASAGGPSGPRSEVVEIVLDTQAPARPVIERVYDNLGDQHGDIEPNGVTDDFWPEISGRVEGGDATYVKLFDKGMPIGTATVNADGTWFFTPVSSLGIGQHSLQVIAVDAAGNESPLSDAWSYETYVPPSLEPSITGVRDDYGAEQGALQKEDFTDDSTPVVRGTGRPGDVMELYLQLEDGALNLGTAYLVGSAVIDAKGHWQIESDDLAQYGGYGMKFLYASSYNEGGDRPAPTGAYPIYLEDPAAPEQLRSLSSALDEPQEPGVAEGEGAGLIQQVLGLAVGTGAALPAGPEPDLAGLLTDIRLPRQFQLEADGSRGITEPTGEVFAPLSSGERLDLLGLQHSQQLVL
ncbi:Ig-like domain-containing protein [Pseudomonas citronellolis]|uniref:Ig-like domain-containing protein n=1 Tax=Pseudomonas citronellolis TaxID=53408 RepID=A0AAW6P1U6_9PSED|nr:Ig-like domain-containing protein [Pseudomonas citronellolis]MDF3841403.1 Ig-like domain-containing protein [Pseudomonas citronellolis]